MASSDESKSEAPGLRVGAGAWKWPPVWPYDNNFFKRQEELDAANKGNDNPLANPMAMMTGGGGAGGAFGAPGGEGDNVTAVEFDSLKFWEGKEDVMTELDERVAEKITK